MPLSNDPKLAALLAGCGDGAIVFLTGAGISAESGIPTFRGAEGYWTIGSTNYTPMQMATSTMFERAPEDVWSWYLWRLGLCLRCAPNQAHLALAELDQRASDRMGLITQNVDGLHQRAGSSEERTFAIHGDIRKMRCANDECGRRLTEMPARGPHERGAPLSASEREVLLCTACGGWMRPHVLWFDEYYEEEYYRSESALALAATASLLVVVGTTGSTSLPVQIGMHCVRRGIPVIDINVEANPFSEMAARTGMVLRQPASEAVPAIVRSILVHLEAN